jgi:hypothetical protein
MRKIKGSILFCSLTLLLSFSSALAQKRSFANEKALDNLLREYLIKHADVYTVDSLGRKARLSDKFILEEYGETVINRFNLKNDSVTTNINTTGIYAVRFADISSRPYLYFQTDNQIEFINLDPETFKLDALLKKVRKFFNKHSSHYTLKEKVQTIKGVMDTLQNNMFNEYSW